MKVTGERVSTAQGGFNPAYQRHAAGYSFCAQRFGPGRVLDIGCGTGHSFHLLAPRETIGIDVDPEALAGQDRETVVADMRELPFADASFDSVLLSHSIEHVPDPERAVAEAARVLRPEGMALFITPNRLTFGRPDELIDPYHDLEFDPGQLERLCRGSFGEVEVLGLFASERYMEIFREERERLDRLLSRDPARLRRFVPRGVKKVAYDALLRRNRPLGDPRAAAITIDDFHLSGDEVESSLDLYAFCAAPSGSGQRSS